MSAALLDTMAQLETAFSRFQLLRAGNPNHVVSGEKGGQFTSGGGSGHGKHWAKRQRRKKKLEKHRKEGHAEIAKVKARQIAERRKASKGEREKLREKHRAERRETVDKLKAKARADFPASKGKSAKSQEYRDRLKKGTEKLAAIHARERQQSLASHVRERQEARKGHRTERKAIREAHKDERAKLVKEHQGYHQEDARYIIKDTRGQDVNHRRGMLVENRTTHLERLKAELKSQKESHRDEVNAHRGEASDERKDLAKSHRDARQHLVKAHKMERRQGIENLKREIQSRSYGPHGEDHEGIYRGFFSRRPFDDEADSSGIELLRAFSAESIVARILSQRGWTRQWRKGELSGKQHLSLLEDCRQFGRARLRHDAETLFDQHGVGDEVQVAVRSNLGESGILGILQSGLAGSDGQASRPILRGIAARASGAVTRFFRRSKQFVHELITAGAMLLKGDEPLTHDEILAIDRQAKRQHEYLDGFEREVRANPPREISDLSTQVIDAMAEGMTANQVVARAESYGNAVWEVQNIGRAQVLKQAVFEAERRVHLLSLEQHRPCKTCLEQSNRGWVTLGSLNEIGDSECMNNCDCYFEWMAPNKKIHVSPWGRHNPKGFNLPGEEGAKLPGYAVPPDVQGKTDQPPEPEKPVRKIVIPAKEVPKPKPAKSDNYPPARPIPSIEEIVKEAGSPFAPDYYEEI